MTVRMLAIVIMCTAELLTTTTTTTTAVRNAAHRRLQQECRTGQAVATWNIVLDAAPGDIGWSIVCNDDANQPVAKYPVGSYANENEGTTKTGSICVNVGATCEFIIQDVAGDGLGGDHGFYSFTYNGRLVALSTNEPTMAFMERQYCFGAFCPTVTDDFVYEDDYYLKRDDYRSDDDHVVGCESDETELTFFLQLDAQPRETGWQLYCDHVLTWNAVPGSLRSSDPANYTQRVCVGATATCELTVYDRGGDGLQSPGYYQVTYNGAVLDTTANWNDPGFTEHSYCVGAACGAGSSISISVIDDDGTDTDDDISSNAHCNADHEETLLFSLTLDDQASDTGWTLHCNHTPVWNVVPGTLSGTAGTTLSQSACIATNQTCELTILDASGDGLDPSNDGWYSLVWGATTIAVSSQEDVAFTERRYCIGMNCTTNNMIAVETDDDDDDDDASMTDDMMSCGANETQIVFTIFLDNHPDETSWYMSCNGEMVWHTPALSLTDYPPGTDLTNAQCVATTATCQFVLTDAGGDGLSAGDDGWYSLGYGATTVAVSTQESSSAWFAERTYCMGLECAPSYSENQDHDDNVPDDDDTDNITCSSDESLLVLTFDATDITNATMLANYAWKLDCDDALLVWNAPRGSIRPNNDDTPIVQQACLVLDATSCIFSIANAWGLAGDGHHVAAAARYQLSLDGDVVVDSSNSSSSSSANNATESGIITRRSYCFGYGCDSIDLGPTTTTPPPPSPQRAAARDKLQILIVLGTVLCALCTVMTLGWIIWSMWKQQRRKQDKQHQRLPSTVRASPHGDLDLTGE